MILRNQDLVIRSAHCHWGVPLVVLVQQLDFSILKNSYLIVFRSTWSFFYYLSFPQIIFYYHVVVDFVQIG